MVDYDVIVVGGGCAGTVAAYEAAKAGASVLLVERGAYSGAKNMTGGRLYTHALREVFPDFEKSAPLERRVCRERISLLTPCSGMAIDYTTQMMNEEHYASYTVLRGSFDKWLAEKPAEVGADSIFGIAVEDLLIKEDGFVSGICAGGDQITAEVVIIADGVNSLLTKKAVGATTPKPSQMGIGIKQTIELPKQVITDRMQVSSNDEGAAWLFAGDATKGHTGGGFLYSNRESISLGLVATISDLATSSMTIYQIFEDFKAHPEVAPIIEGGKVVEHSGHMVPEGGFTMMPELTGNGVLLAGESAMMCVNLGYMVRGMDYAIAAGMNAGRVAAKATQNKDCSKAGLQPYIDALESSFVLKDLKQYEKFPHYLETTTRLFKEYPELFEQVMNSLFLVDGSPAKPLKKKFRSALRRIGLSNVIRDVKGAMKAL